MALTNSDIVDFVIWLTGRSRDNVEILLEEWMSDRDSAYISPENKEVLKKVKQTPESILKGLETKHRNLVENVAKRYDEMTTEEHAQFREELNNLEFEIEKHERIIRGD